MGRVGHPAARLDLIGVESPVFEFGFEERTAHVRRVVQLARAVVVEDLREHARMPVEVEFVEDSIVVRESFGETREACGGNLLQRRFIYPDAKQQLINQTACALDLQVSWRIPPTFRITRLSASAMR